MEAEGIAEVLNVYSVFTREEDAANVSVKEVVVILDRIKIDKEVLKKLAVLK